MEKIIDKETQKKQRVIIQQRVNEEQMKFQHQQQKDREEAVLRQQQREQEWYMQKMDMEKQIQANHSGIMQENASSTIDPKV